jgi:hypothetical protein
MGRRISAENIDAAIEPILVAIVGYLSKALDTRMLSSAGLVIKAGGGVLVKTGGTACQAICAGVLRSIGAATDMAAFSGTVTNAKFNVYCFFIDSAGVLTSAMGTEGATLAAVIFPPMPANKACIGFTIINPTGTGNFVGNTTALDDGTVVPNAVHVSVQGGFDPAFSSNLLP